MVSKEKFYKLSERVGARSPKNNSGLWLDRYFIREVAPLLAYYFARMKVSANAVTLLFFGIGLAADFILLLPFWWTPAATFVLYVIVRILDHVDGRLARFYKTQSKFGEALDNFTELFIESGFFLALGVRLYLETNSFWPLFIGGVAVFTYLYENLWVRLSEEIVGRFEATNPSTFSSRARALYVNYDYILTTSLLVVVLYALQARIGIPFLVFWFFALHVFISFILKIVLRFIFVLRKAQTATFSGPGRHIFKSGKIHSLQNTAKILEQERKGKRVVYFSGVFDLFHFGHFKALKSARSLGDILVVQINSDEHTRARKGPDRPYLSEEFRAEMISAFELVNYVFIHDQYMSEPAKLDLLRPDLVVSAQRKSESDIFRSEREKEWKAIVPGMEVVWLEETPEISTSKIIPIIKPDDDNSSALALPTISIGISAYNEEYNIEQLLRALCSQKEPSFVLKEVVVVSDGSTDQTVQIVRAFSDPRVKLVELPKRGGKNKAQNIICESASGDFLLMIDADSLPLNDNYLTEMVNPLIMDPNIGIASSEVLPLEAQTNVEKIISFGHVLKRQIFRRWKNGRNIYECHGRSRIFSKRLYKSIKWPDDCVEDAYSYLIAAQKGFSFRFISRTAVYFRAPQNLRDYIKQSSRFLQSTITLRRHLDDDFVKSEYRFPRLIGIKILLTEFFKHPFLTIEYISLHLFSRIAAKLLTFDQSFIEPSATSKKLTTNGEF